ncbi:hypothetical protein M427DRAFT_54534 [Gonapodya prolifera JEL478]|uniref:Peroxiredoxin-like 2A n=1 Tax=Gonapodya prolifera (strain JEL478) TaxID=1344416 RepID=A0A139ALH8_GONPJ|nr:hypothetical protein M427DRAFT_54534 [Gonapodya prolifera JEL478]|eukprot:KXS17610.1 hypothetical protein M427DRAFT_54534 [Gonapodya prolifera JEL478]
MVAVVHEERGAKDFAENYWKKPLYLDEEKKLYELVQGGKQNWASVFSLFSSDVRANLSRANGKGVEGNLQGEGRLLGGLALISTKGVHYSYAEKHFGDHAPMTEVLQAVSGISGEASNP